MNYIELPNILEETSRGTQAIRIEDDLLRNRDIFLTTEIDSKSSSDILINQLHFI